MRLGNSRIWITFLTFASIAAGVVAFCLAEFASWRFGLPTNDKAVVINTVVATEACLLVAVAGIVAWAAYLAASGQPDLDIQVQFPFSLANEPVFVAADQEDRPRIDGFKQAQGELLLVNRSRYSARNPGVRIRLEALAGLKDAPGWQPLDWATTVGLVMIQWDGDIIHGQWSRKLPVLDLSDVLELAPGTAALVVTIAADGIKPITRRFPVKVLRRPEYDEYQQRRNEIIEAQLRDRGPDHWL